MKKTTPKRYTVYERDSLQSWGDAMRRDCSVISTDDLNDALETLWSMYEDELLGFIVDHETGLGTRAMYEVPTWEPIRA